MIRPHSLLLIALAAILSLATYWTLAADGVDGKSGLDGAGSIESGAPSNGMYVDREESGPSKGSRSTALRGAQAAQGRAAKSALGTSAEAGFGASVGSSSLVSAREAVFASSPGGVPFSWRGRLRDGVLRGEIADAIVILTAGDRRSEGVSNEDGFFEVDWFEGLPADLRVEHASYLDLTMAALELEPEAEFELLPSAKIRGHLSPVPPVDADADEPTRVDLWRETSKGGKDWPRTTALVDERGQFEFEDLGPGNYSLCAFAGAWTGRLESGVHVEGGESKFVELVCAQGATLDGMLSWSETPATDEANRLLELIELTLSPRDKGLPTVLREERELTAVVAEGGAFRVEGIAPGRHRLVLETPWGAKPSFQVEVDASGDRMEQEFKVQAPGSLSGHVLDSQGSPMPGARVSVVRRKDKSGLFNSLDTQVQDDGDSRLFQGPVVTGDDGAFFLGVVPVGEELYAVATAPPSEDAPAPMWSTIAPVAPGEARSGVSLRFEAPRYLRGHVRVAGALDAVGDHLSGARIQAKFSSDGKEHTLQVGYSEQDGSYEIGPLIGGAFRLEASCEGYIDESLAVVVGDSDQEGVDLSLVKAMSFAGIVVDESGAAVSGLRIRASFDDPDVERENRKAGQKRTAEKSGAEARLTHADEFGRFRLEGLLPGAYYLSPVSSDWELVRTAPRVMDELSASSEETMEVVVQRRDRVDTCSVTFVAIASQTGLVPEDLEVKGLNGMVILDGSEVHASGLAPGPVRIILSARDCAPKLIELELVPGENYPLGLVRLDPGATLTVTVKNQKGSQTLSKASVKLLGVAVNMGGFGEEVTAFKAKSMGEGRYRISGVPLGSWRLRVDRDGYKRYTTPLVVDALKMSTTVKLASKRP